MRKHQQKQVLELIKTLNEAYAEIKRLFSRREFAAVLQLLSDCQDFVVQIGSYIKSVEDEGTQTVALLEECHEALYQIGSKINEGNPDGNLIKRLRERFLKIEGSVHSELKPNKIEVVFLPYMAAMWDSLESIWLVARDDPNCDAYVVPVPYYDRLPDGTLGQMHYEGDQYPAYVPITDWQVYDIEARHPDIIFIHNPYDGGNHVTIIHPSYYSKRLKVFTDLLVYVPYFVCVDDVPEHFCVCAGTLHADKVIVQSEKIRQTYIRVFKAAEKENGCAGKFGKAEDKFVALGSPKFDKVIHSKPEDFTLPDEWRRLIDRPDGTQKKTVLYNTTIGAILRGEEAYLKKIRCVLDTFRDRDDVVLWWRPHPLNKEAFQSMRLKLLDEYEQIVTEYKREGFGFYDDTPDLNRSICLSSVYYGDMSSLVAMYKITGKLAMIQNINALSSKSEAATLAFETLCDDGESFWCTAYEYNALFKIDKATWQVEYAGCFPHEKLDGLRLYTAIAKCDGRLFFAPGRAEEIAVFDIGSKTFTKIQIKKPDSIALVKNSHHLKFCDIVLRGDYLYFVPCSYPAFVELNIATGEVCYYSDWLSKLSGYINDPLEAFFWHKSAMIGSSFFVAACNANAVVSFNMDTRTSIAHEVGSASNRYSDICYDGERLWMAPRHDGPIVAWDPKTGRWTEFGAYPEEFSNAKYSFNDIVYSNGHVWAFPNKANATLKINVQSGYIFIADAFSQMCQLTDDQTSYKRSHYLLAKICNGKLLAYNGKNNLLMEYDCDTDSFNAMPVQLEPESINARKKAFSKEAFGKQKNGKDYCIKENKLLVIDDFVTYIAEKNEDSGDENVETGYFAGMASYADGSSGKAILAYCKQDVFRKGEQI